MKTIIYTLLLFVAGTISLEAQTQKVYKIDYKSIVEGQKVDEKTNEFNLRAWVNDTFNKVVTNDEDNGAQILNKQSNTSFLLYGPSEQYHILEEGNNDAYNPDNDELPFSLVSEKSKSIAGYDCKLAEINLDPESNDDDLTIKIWYTEKIPVIYWGQFSFLKNIPGAALEVMIGDNGFTAYGVSQESVPSDFFEIPETYTELDMVSDEIEEENQQAVDAAVAIDTQIDDDRFLYYDESETLLGMKDENDNPITKAEYSYFDYFRDGITTVITPDGKFGSMDKNGNIKIGFKYDYLSYDEQNEQYIYGLGDKYGILSASDIPVINAQYDMVSHMNQGYVSVTINEKSGILNKTGNVVVPISYPLIMQFNSEVFVTSDNEQYLLYNLKQNKKVSDSYDLIALSDDVPVHLVKKGDKYGYMDNSGKIIIPIQYAGATTFDDNHATVETEDGKVSLINSKGEIVESY